MNKNKRPQSPKRINRHDSAIGDKRRARSGPVIRGQRFDRNDFRTSMQRGEW